MYDEWFVIATETIVEYLFERFGLDRDLIVAVEGNIFHVRKGVLRVIGHYEVPYREVDPHDFGLDEGLELAGTRLKYEHTSERVEEVVRSWMVNKVAQKLQMLRKGRD
jgi:hypothetical protein